MIGKLKMWLLAAMALSALGALAAGSAHAAEEKFHCSVEPCRVTAKADGTGTTAHQVLVISDTREHSVSFTCASIKGEGSSATKTTAEFKLENIEYVQSCTVNGSGKWDLRMNGCTYLYRSTGGAGGTAELHVECPGTKHIELEITNFSGATLCTLEFTPQTLTTGVKYKNVGTVGSREVTVEVSVPGISVESKAGDTLAGCGINPEETLTGKYTTGNTLATAENAGGVMADAWFE